MSLTEIENRISDIEHKDFHSREDQESLRLLLDQQSYLLSLKNVQWDKTPPERVLVDTHIEGQPELFQGAA